MMQIVAKTIENIILGLADKGQVASIVLVVTNCFTLLGLLACYVLMKVQITSWKKRADECHQCLADLTNRLMDKN